MLVNVSVQKSLKNERVPNLESGVIGLSVKIRVSYERPEELEQVRERLADMVRSCKESRNREGKYRKAYLELKEGREEYRRDFRLYKNLTEKT